MSIIEGRKTTSLVHLNTKIEAINIEHLDYGGDAITEGKLIAEDATTKKARVATAGAVGTGDIFVLVNWLDTAHGSVKDAQTDPFDETAPTITEGTGGLAGIFGNGVPLGIHTKHWDDIGTYAPAVGKVVIIGDSGLPRALPISGGGAIANNVPYFGSIYRVRENIVWFFFESNGQVTGI